MCNVFSISIQYKRVKKIVKMFEKVVANKCSLSKKKKKKYKNPDMRNVVSVPNRPCKCYTEILLLRYNICVEQYILGNHFGFKFSFLLFFLSFKNGETVVSLLFTRSTA